jgi:hypothetical protein
LSAHWQHQKNCAASAARLQSQVKIAAADHIGAGVGLLDAAAARFKKMSVKLKKIRVSKN